MRPIEYYMDRFSETNSIDVFTTSDARKLKTNPASYFYRLYEDARRQGDYIVLKKIEYMESMILKLNNDDVSTWDDEDIELFNNIKNYIMLKVRECVRKEDPFMLSSILVQNRRDLPHFYTNAEMKELDAYVKQMEKKAASAYVSFSRGSTLTPRQRESLYSYLLYKMGSDDEDIYKVCDNCLQYLVDDKIKLSKIELEFVTNYLCLQDWSYGVSTCPKVFIAKPKSKNAIGASIGQRRDILISPYYVGHQIMEPHDDSFFENVTSHSEETDSLPFVLFHEIQHQRQTDDKANKVISLTALYEEFRALLTKANDKEFKDYRANYDYKEIETESNMVGAIKAKYFARKYYPEYEPIYEKVQKYFTKKFSKAVFVNRNNKKEDSVTYNIENISQILEQNPKLLKRGSALSVGFNRDGTIKSLYTLIQDYQEELEEGRNRRIEQVYDYFFSYYMYNQNDRYLRKDHMKYMTEDEQITFIILLQRFVKNELKSLANIFDSINEHDISAKSKNGEDTNYDGLTKVIDKKIDGLLFAYNRLASIENTRVIERFMLDDSRMNQQLKLLQIKDTLKAIKNSNLTSYVLNNPNIAKDPYFLGAARRVDNYAQSAWINNGRDTIRRIIGIKPPDSLNNKKR